jgi:DNA-binding NarL/FixJ family response regulator
VQPADVIRVAIVEDDRGTREGLAMLIGGTPGYSCAGAFGSVEEALGAIARLPADILLLDVNLPGIAGSDGVRLIRERAPALQVLMLTVFAEQDTVFASICNGACGYLLKKTPPARLLEAIQEAHGGGAPMSPEIARKVVSLFHKTGPPAKVDAHLMPQELRLLRLLAEGSSYQAAAAHMRISIDTVRNYIRSIYSKLHVHSRSEAVTKALRARLIY